MSGVYAQASCTISSCGSSSSEGGCFHNRNPLLHFGCTLLSDGKDAVYVKLSETVDESFSFASEVNDSPLSKRSWAFQERLLSRRILHFGSSFLFFECNTSYASERQPKGIKYKRLNRLKRDGTEYDRTELTQRQNMHSQFLPDPRGYNGATAIGKYGRAQRRARARSRKRNPHYQPPNVVAEIFDDAVFGYRGAFQNLTLQPSTVQTPRQQLRLHQRWFELVSMYTSGQLTQPTDRLMGISGIAKKIQNQRGLEYLGGLWKHRLVFDLLWTLQEKPKPKPTTYRVPSWSWASIDGRVGQCLLPFTEENENKKVDIKITAKVCEAVVTTSAKATTSATAFIDGGYLVLECHLVGGLCASFPTGEIASAPGFARLEDRASLNFTPDYLRDDQGATGSKETSPSSSMNDSVPSGQTRAISKESDRSMIPDDSISHIPTTDVDSNEDERPNDLNGPASKNPPATASNSIDVANILNDSAAFEELFCAEILRLDFPRGSGGGYELIAIHGLVLRKRDIGGKAEYERVGKFLMDATKYQSYVDGPKLVGSEDMFERAALERIRVV